MGKRIGVLAIDPSSRFTGGAVLGDRGRMMHHGTDSGVFIRSMATRGHLGGLAWSTPQAIRVLEACFDVVLIETVGVGQSEIDIARLADTTIVVLAPGFGDSIQFAKAGLLKIADLFVVNKADRDGADAVVRDLNSMVALGRPRAPEQPWNPPVGADRAAATLAPLVEGEVRAARNKSRTARVGLNDKLSGIRSSLA